MFVTLQPACIVPAEWATMGNLVKGVGYHLGGRGATSTGSTGKLISCNTALRLNLSFVCKHLEEEVGEQLRAA